MRVRGLKHQKRMSVQLAFASHPMRVRGLKHYAMWEISLVNVAPHAGAWIETFDPKVLPKEVASHPMRVRGLKLDKDNQVVESSPSHPMRVRGLKHFGVLTIPIYLCRTPCGCVD